MKKISIFFVTVLSLLLVTNFASAQSGSSNNSGGTSGTSNNTCPAGTTCLENPLGNDNTSPQKLIGNVINAVMGIVGSIALLMFIFGGLTWMLSGGSSEKVKKGKDILVWSAVGLAVIFSSYALVYFVITKIK